MKVSDLVSGLLVAILGLAVIAIARGFPAPLQGGVGPSLFPTILGSILLACGLLIAGGALAGGHAFPLGYRPAWTRNPRAALAVASVPLAIVVFAAGMGTAGFLATMASVLFPLLVVFGIRWPTALATALITTVALHLLFSQVLRVPLPRGIIEELIS